MRRTVSLLFLDMYKQGGPKSVSIWHCLSVAVAKMGALESSEFCGHRDEVCANAKKRRNVVGTTNDMTKILPNVYFTGRVRPSSRSGFSTLAYMKLDSDKVNVMKITLHQKDSSLSEKFKNEWPQMIMGMCNK